MATLLGPLLAAGIALAVPAVGGGPSPTWQEVGAPGRPDAPDGPEVRDPFFALLLELADTDSLVAWSGTEVRAALALRGGPSRLPLAEVDSLVRRRPRPAEPALWPGATAVATWELVLPAALARPMPYAILGYHPGTVRCGRRLVLLELRVPDVVLQVARDGEPQAVAATEVRIHPVLEGYLALDVDGVVDALLGSLVDDSWTLAIVSARLDGERVGIATAVGRTGQPIFGELDFRGDRIRLDGRPEAAALSRRARALLGARRGALPAPWSQP